MQIGIDLGGTKIEGAVLDFHGNIQLRQRVETPQDNYSATVNAIAELVQTLEREAGKVCTVGVGIPGTISRSSGLVKNANSTCLIGHPLDRDLSALLGRAVRLANDANCFALSEARDGAAANAGTVFGVILGTGVGGGLVVDGQIVNGLNGIAGEWGHNPLPWAEVGEQPGVSCYCGLNGCIETFLCGAGLVRAYRSETAGQPMLSISAEDIAGLARTGNETAQKSIYSYTQRLARGLASVVNIFDPEVIVLGGGLSNIETLYDDVPALWDQWIFSDIIETKLVRNMHGDSSGVRGAAWLWPVQTEETA